MDTQTIMVLLIFCFAVFYVAKLVYKSLNNNKGCASGCNKCAADFSKVVEKSK